MPWLDALQLALIEENYEELSLLCQELPALDTDEMIEAKNLIDEAIKLLKKSQGDIQITMQKIQKNRAFLTQEEKKSRLCTLS